MRGLPQYGGIVIVGIIEIFIGLITLIAIAGSLFLGKSTKPPEVFIFVFITSIISCSLGIGILKRNLTSYHLLLFFATVVILTKLLIFAKIITLSGALETIIPQSLKNIISVIYHSSIIWYFSRSEIKKQFGERRDGRFHFGKKFLGKIR